MTTLRERKKSTTKNSKKKSKQKRVTRPERPKGVKVVVKQARRAHSRPDGPLSRLQVLQYRMDPNGGTQQPFNA